MKPEKIYVQFYEDSRVDISLSPKEGYSEYILSDFVKRMLAYLEKQKEPVVDKEGMYYYLGGKFIYCGFPATTENPYDFAISQQEKEQKPSISPVGIGEVHWNPISPEQVKQRQLEWKLPDDFEEAVYKVANFISPFGSQEELRKTSHRFAEQLMSLAKKELAKKPVEWKDRPAGWNEEKEAKYQHEMSYIPKPEKPAGCSEESESIEELIAFLHYYHTGQGKRIPFDEKWISYLETQKEIRDRYKVKNEDESELTQFESELFSAGSLLWQTYMLGGEVNFCVWAKDCSKDLLEAARKELEQKPVEWDYYNRIQYDSLKSGIEAFASTYSFNIESKLFPQLTKEQQRLWREEIEQAVIAGGEGGIELSRDNRYKENRMMGWSEKEKKNLELVIDCVYEFYPDPVMKYRLKDWLKSLPERFNLQPKQEWSEEDRDRVAQYLHDRDGGMLWSKATEITSDILDMLRPQPTEWSEEDEAAYDAFICEVVNEKMNPTIEQVKWLRSLRGRLKSLRPSSKPSEINPEEVRLLDTTISFLKDFADKGYENAVECIDWLKSKRNGTARK